MAKFCLGSVFDLSFDHEFYRTGCNDIKNWLSIRVTEFIDNKLCCFAQYLPFLFVHRVLSLTK